MQNTEGTSVRIFESGRYNFDLFQLSDAKLRTDDGCIFDIHRVLLAKSSDYFGVMFCGLDKFTKEFPISGISGDCLSDILCYIYTGHSRVTERNVVDLMMAADYLLLKDLYMEIKQSIKAIMTEANCLRILLTAHQISDKDIFQESFRFIQTRFEGVVRCQKDDLSDLPLEILSSILSSRSLYVYNENTVWKTIVEWTQKDISVRMRYVAQLLLTLAMEDMGEELVTEIVQHDIISKNYFMNDLIEIRSIKDVTSNLDVILSFLRSYSNSHLERFSHRIPLNLHVISIRNVRDDEDEKFNLYITYDENPDLCRKITGVSFQPEFLIAIGHNIFILNLSEKICKNFDLSVMDWVRMENFRCARFNLSVVAIDAHIYVLGKISMELRRWKYYVRVYDIANNRWFEGVPLPNIRHGAAVSFEKNIYVVGCSSNTDGMVTHMFDPVTQQWSLLSSPIVDRCMFALVVYHKKIYLLGGSILEEDYSSAEVFDPATNLWKTVQNLPYSYSEIKAMVFNDQLIVYEGAWERERSTKNVCWNDAMECWDKSAETDTLKDLHLYRFCTVDDVYTIRMITKQNRDPNTQLVKSPFN